MRQRITALLVSMAALAVYAAKAEVTTHVTIPVASVISVPCAVAGEGEQVALTGSVEAVFVTALDATGEMHIVTVINQTGISGTGLTTGAKYQATGVNRFSFSSSGQVSEFTFVNNFQLIGPGRDNNLVMHETIHLTVKSSGEITANVANFSIDCK